MLKRIGLFLLTNALVLAVFFVVTIILQEFFGISLSRETLIGLFGMCLILGFSGSFISLFLSKWMAKRSYNIQIIDKDEVYNLSKKEKVVWDTVQALAERNNIKMPEVGIYQSAEPNAFATGASKNSSLVAVSTGLMDLMDEDAIEGVIGHEMAHVLNGDMVTMTLLQGIVNTFVLFLAKLISGIATSVMDEKYSRYAYYLSDGVLQVLFGFLASIVTMWFSRHREYRADAGSAKFVGKEKMIAGLEALLKMQNANYFTDTNKQYATMQISTGKVSGLTKLFSSHPDLEDRIKALEELKIY